MIVFDLDGCLIDSRELIRESYRDAGIDPPDDFMTFGNHNWTGDEELHARKDAAYLRRLTEGRVRVLPPWQTVRALSRVGYDTGLITGAPPGTLAAVQKWLRPWPFTAASDGLKPSQKALWLGAASPAGVYVDDQEYVTVPGGWRLIRYIGQSAQELYRQVTGEAVRGGGVAAGS